MSLRRIALWSAGRPTPFLMAQWRRRGALQPLNPRVGYLEKDGTANGLLRGLWKAAFPTAQSLPVGPLSEADGRGTDDFWDVLP